LSLFGKNFAAIGNMNIQAFYCSNVFFFNKQMVENNKLDNLYDVVRDGNWTMDYMIELSRSLYRDLNGNSETDEKDQYGLTYNSYGWQVMHYGSGMPFVHRDDNGALLFNSTDEKLINSVMRIVEVTQEKQTVLYAENFTHIEAPPLGPRAQIPLDAFTQDRVLFWLDAIYAITRLRDMPGDFGILPAPKYDDQQEEYASALHPSNATSTAVPMSVKADQLDMVGRVLEDLQRDSGKVRDAFIETVLKDKMARDNDTAEMIDLIIDTLTIDFGMRGVLSLDDDMRELVNNGLTTVASTLASNAKMYQQTLESYNALGQDK